MENVEDPSLESDQCIDCGCEFNVIGLNTDALTSITQYCPYCGEEILYDTDYNELRFDDDGSDEE
jgi:DNA-directed RNA polymerase subunit RPC12/RpoP|tara:strand:+ start:414 stop:608 length:195 start_codon:yes stop_codon:yes gene_type:complete